MATEQDRQWVDDFLSGPYMDMPWEPSFVAERLRDPAMTPQARDLLLQTMIRSDSLDAAKLFGNDGFRAFESSDPAVATALASDRQTVGAALGGAFASGAITTDDLLKLGDLPDVGAAQNRMIAVLQAGGAESRDALLSVAGELSTRTPARENDKALATMIFAEDPQSRSALGPDKARQAFEALVEQSKESPFDPHTSNFDQDRQKHLIAAATSLYAEYGDQFLSHYTGANNQHGEMETVAKFLSLSALDPHAQNITMPDGRTIGETVNATTDAFVNTLLTNIERLNDHPQNQRNATRQLGRLHAGMTAAEEVAEHRHASAVAGDAAIAERISGAAEQLVAITPADRIPGAAEAAGAAVGALIEGAQPDRPAPDSNGDATAFDSYEDALGKIEGRLGRNAPDIQDQFNDTRETELGQVRGILTDQHLLSASLMNQESHPQYSHYASCHAACERANLGLASAELDNAAAALAVRSMADGLPKVDHVVSSRDATHLFAVAGRMDDPGHTRTMMPRDVAIHQTIAESTKQAETIALAQQNSLIGNPHEQEMAKRSHVV